MQRRRGSLARASASAFATADIVEYHPSMSLEAPAALVLSSASSASVSVGKQATPETPAPTLEAVLATRAALWGRVDALLDALASNAHDADAYARECEALRQLQQLHFLCNILFPTLYQRETHLRTLQLAAHRQLQQSTPPSAPHTN